MAKHQGQAGQGQAGCEKFTSYHASIYTLQKTASPQNPGTIPRKLCLHVFAFGGFFSLPIAGFPPESTFDCKCSREYCQIVENPPNVCNPDDLLGNRFRAFSPKWENRSGNWPLPRKYDKIGTIAQIGNQRKILFLVYFQTCLFSYLG